MNEMRNHGGHNHGGHHHGGHYHGGHHHGGHHDHHHHGHSGGGGSWGWGGGTFFPGSFAGGIRRTDSWSINKWRRLLSGAVSSCIYSVISNAVPCTIPNTISIWGLLINKYKKQTVLVCFFVFNERYVIREKITMGFYL